MKTKLKIREYLKRVLCTVMLIVLFFPAQKAEAAVSKEDAGAAIASFAIDFYNKYGTRVHWYDVNLSDPSSYGKRAAAYNEATVGSMQDYYMDCVGWVSYAIHHATGLDDSGPSSGRGSFVSPSSCGRYFEDVTGQELKPGDILSNSHHVMIYVGNNKLIDSRSANGLTYTTLEEYGTNGNYTSAQYGGGTWGVYDNVYRINDSGAAAINESDLVSIISGLNSDSSKKKDYNYYGLPKKGEYVGSSGTLSKLKAIINVLSQIADYLIGLLTLGIKIELIGWTTIVENLITDMVNEITGTELQAAANSPNPSGETSTEDSDSLYTPDATETVTGFFTDKNDRLTIEKIIYNQVPIFDVNIFNITEAGGQQLDSNGTLATVKKNIAKWYYVFRNIAIIGLLLVLLYMGIRMAISTAAADKAVYKRYLKDWLVSFIIVFSMHYIMIFILSINENLVDLMKNSSPNSEYFLYETVRTKAYELKFTSGIAGTIMYMVLVYLMIKYLFIYAKRYLTINILAVIAPLIGITYSIDKIKDNKSQSLSAWLQDFTFTTLLQTVHALIYTIFIPIAIESSEENIGGIIFAFVLLNFMAKADKIVTNIFGMSGGKALSNLLKGDGQKNLFAKLAAVKTIGGFYKSGAKLAGRAIKGVGTTIGQVGGIVIPENTRYRFNSWYNDTANNLLGENHFINERRTNNIQTVSGIDKKLRAKKLEYRKALKGNISGPFNFAKTGVKFTFAGMVAIPALVIDPGEGIKKAIEVKGTKKILDSTAEKSKLKAHKTGKGSLNNVVMHRTRGMNNGQAGSSGSSAKKSTGVKAALQNKKTTSQMLQARFSKSISMLNQAKSLEESIIMGYGGIRQSVNDRFNSNQATSAASKVPGVILAKLNDQYDKMVDEIFKEVEQADIQAVVEEYVRREKTTKIEYSDVGSIVTMLQARLDKNKDNNIKISDTDLTANIEETIEESVNDRLAKGIANVLKKNDISSDEFDSKKQKNIAKELKKILSKTDDEQTLFDALDKALVDNGVTTNISNETKKDIVKNLKRRMKNQEDKVYTPTEIIGIIKKGLDKKGSIERESIPSQFEDIAENMEKLKEINNQYGKDFGEKIFTKDEIVKAMKETKNAKKFDLYSSLVKEE